MDLFERNNIFSHRENEARHEIMLETYIKKIQIESRVMGSIWRVTISSLLLLSTKHLLVQNVEGMKDIGLPKDTYAAQLELIQGDQQLISPSSKRMSMI
jgi:glutamine synthetase